MKKFERDLLKEWYRKSNKRKKIKPKVKTEKIYKRYIDNVKAFKKEQNRNAFGVFCGIFINFFSLIIAYKYYGEDSEERRTFLKGWGIGIGILLLALIVLAITFIVLALNKDGGRRLFEPY